MNQISTNLEFKPNKNILYVLIMGHTKHKLEFDN